MESIVVFSHLDWDFVFQRPQHLLSRLGQNYRVLFVQEPRYGRRASYKLTRPAPGVVVCQITVPVSSEAFSDEQIPFVRNLLGRVLSAEQISEYVLWLYTPMAVRLAKTMTGHQAVVYDCMDELTNFLHAPVELGNREIELLEWADLVFTGGPSLYEAKRKQHPNVYCFPSSVDSAHFRRSATAANRPKDQSSIPRPRLGYFGVIDERLDLSLLQLLATEHRDWQIIMIGPIAKIDRASLPSLPNLHFLGGKDYAELPDYLSGWDVCLLPFAQNEATRFISPTKTLEYMAGERMIVSTAVHDVVSQYEDIVFIGRSPLDFVTACERALGCAEIEKRRRLNRMRQVLRKTSWERTAKEMEVLIRAAVQERYARRSEARPGRKLNAQTQGVQARKVTGGPSRSHAPVVVIGAGPTGLSAGFHLGPESVVLEQGDQPGGLCRSIETDGFTFDYAGHIMFSNDAYVHEMYKMLLGENVHWQDREAWVFSKGVYTRYPFQGALYGLPPEVIKECLVGAIEARFGPLQSDLPSMLSPKVPDAGSGCRSGGSVDDCCADGVLEGTVPLGQLSSRCQSGNGESENFHDFIYRVWGAGIAKHFAIPYNRKLWGVPLNEMEISWLGGRVPLPDLAEMIEGALKPVPKPMGPNARFGYPLRGGFQALMNGFLPHLKCSLELNCRVSRVSPKRRSVTLADGRKIGYEYLISTMPLPQLVAAMGEEAPTSIREAVARLRHVSVRCVHLGVGRENLTEKHWIYYPEDTVFHRIFVQGNASPHCNPPGGFGLTCEITYSPSKPLPCDDDDLVQRCIDDCRQVGIVGPGDPIRTSVQVDLPYAYVVYDHTRAQSVSSIREWLAARDIVLAGRYSEWEYYNSDHAFLAGKKAADEVKRIQQFQQATGLKGA